jgi:hypothetical protein
MTTRPASSTHSPPTIAIVYYGDDERRRTATPETSKVPSVFAALEAVGLKGVPVVYNDGARDAVLAQLLGMQGALVWVNPIEAGHDRSKLDALLREVAAAGCFVSTHPDVILKLGTKQILVDTQHISWSAAGTAAHHTPQALRDALAAHVRNGETRVLKQYRGHSGMGIWKVKPASNTAHDNMLVRVREAPRGSVEEVLSLDAFVERCTTYFSNDGRMVDQPYQPRLPEGMIRCYLVQNRVEGFGHQAVNALCPALEGEPRDAFPLPSKRLYFPPDKPEFQALKHQLEIEWVPALQAHFGLTTDALPVLWDCDFLLGPKTADGKDTYVLCEINVSSVSPFPESILAPMARAVAIGQARLEADIRDLRACR